MATQRDRLLPGTVRGKVKVILDHKVSSLNGDILVTSAPTLAQMTLSLVHQVLSPNVESVLSHSGSGIAEWGKLI